MIVVHRFIIGLVMTTLMSTAARGIALTAAHEELREMMAAKSVAALDTNQFLRARTNEQRETCAAQLKLKAIPTACFDSADPKTQPAQLASLTRLCITNARASRSRLDLTISTASQTLLPESCLIVARERLDDLRYVDESQRPELSGVRTDGINLEE